MAEEHGDEYLNALATFVEQFAEPLLDGSIVLKLKPLGLLYLDSRFSGLSELEALRSDAPVDYLRAVVADLGDHRKLEKLRGLLRMIERVKIVGATAPLRDSTPLRISCLSTLRHVEIHGCDLSTVAAKGLLELKSTLETLVCVDSTDSLADLLADHSAPPASQTPWFRLTRLVGPLNHLRLMDPSLCLLPVVEEIDLSRNNLSTVANLHYCVRLTKLDLGCNSIASLVGLNRVVGAITHLVLRGNGIHSLAGLEKLYAVESLDLAHNVVGSLSEVARLGRLPSLTRLWLEGNPIELRRNYRAEVLGLLQDGEKVELDGRKSSTFERFAIRRQQRRHVSAPRFPPPLPPLGVHVFVAQSATSALGGEPIAPKVSASRTVEPETEAEPPDESSAIPSQSKCIMERPEEDPGRMFSSSPRALLRKRSPGTGGRNPSDTDETSFDAVTSSAEDETFSETSLGGEATVNNRSVPFRGRGMNTTALEAGETGDGVNRTAGASEGIRTSVNKRGEQYLAPEKARLENIDTTDAAAREIGESVNGAVGVVNTTDSAAREKGEGVDRTFGGVAGTHNIASAADDYCANIRLGIGQAPLLEVLAFGTEENETPKTASVRNDVNTVNTGTVSGDSADGGFVNTEQHPGEPGENGNLRTLDKRSREVAPGCCHEAAASEAIIWEKDPGELVSVSTIGLLEGFTEGLTEEMTASECGDRQSVTKPTPGDRSRNGDCNGSRNGKGSGLRRFSPETSYELGCRKEGLSTMPNERDAQECEKAGLREGSPGAEASETDAGTADTEKIFAFREGKPAAALAEPQSRERAGGSTGERGALSGDLGGVCNGREAELGPQQDDALSVRSEASTAEKLLEGAGAAVEKEVLTVMDGTALSRSGVTASVVGSKEKEQSQEVVSPKASPGASTPNGLTRPTLSDGRKRTGNKKARIVDLG